MHEYDDLNEFEGEFVPQPAIRAGLDSLPDGVYDFEIVDAELTKAQNGDRICCLGLRNNLGVLVQHTYWLTRQVAINRMGYDFEILGQPIGQPLSETIPAAVRKLPGTKFRGTKSSRFVPGTNGKKDATYHDLSISGRVQAMSKAASKAHEEIAF